MSEAPPPPDVVVAIPAHDEVEHLAGCLHAVADAVVHARAGRVIARAVVVVVAHRCTDGTAEVAVDVLRSRLDEVEFDVLRLDEQADVGAVRDLAVRHGLAGLGAPEHAWLFSTDADTVVPRDWITEALSEAAASDSVAVAGLTTLDRWIGSTAGRESYDDIIERGLYVEADGRLAHRHVYGANLVVRCDAYLDVGGFPHHGHGEDQRLVDALAVTGHRVLRSRTLVVSTSGRMDGRARDGLAHLLLRLDSVARQVGGPHRPPHPRRAGGSPEGEIAHGVGGAGERGNHVPPYLQGQTLTLCDQRHARCGSCRDARGGCEPWSGPVVGMTLAGQIGV